MGQPSGGSGNALVLAIFALCGATAARTAARTVAPPRHARPPRGATDAALRVAAAPTRHTARLLWPRALQWRY